MRLIEFQKSGLIPEDCDPWSGSVTTHPPVKRVTMRILIADSDRTFLENFQSYIWDNGFDAETATTGLECSAILYRYVPDILVIDRELLWGGCDGVLAKMQADPTLAQIPIIILMTYTEDESQSFSNPNVVAWMQKPFQLRDSLDQITWAMGMFRPEGGLVLKKPERIRSLSQ